MKTHGAMAPPAKPDFGTQLRRQREARGVSLRRIADATKISVGVLDALERNDISRLPGGIFSRAFVRSYAVEVGLNPEETVRDFMIQFPQESVTAGSPNAPQLSSRLDESRSRKPSMTIVAVVALSVLLGVILFFTLASRP